MSSPLPSESNPQKLELAALSSNPIQLPGSATGCLLPRPGGNSVTGRLKRKLEFEDGRHVAKIALRMLDCNDEIRQGVDRCPIWPNGFVGSISHSENFAWAVAGSETEFASIGIDTEPIADKVTARHLREEIGIQSEWSLGESAGLTPLEAFTTIFSAKESLYKCIYPLRPVFFGFHHARVVDFGARQLRIRIQPDCPNDLLCNQEIDVAYITTENNSFTASWLMTEGGIR